MLCSLRDDGGANLRDERLESEGSGTCFSHGPECRLVRAAVRREGVSRVSSPSLVALATETSASRVTPAALEPR